MNKLFLYTLVVIASATAPLSMAVDTFVYTKDTVLKEKTGKSKLYTNNDVLVSMSNKKYRECILTELDYCKCLNKLNNTNHSCNKGNFSKVKSIPISPFSSESGRLITVVGAE